MNVHANGEGGRSAREQGAYALSAAVAHDASGRRLDRIRVLGISAIGYHGVFEHERRDGQEFVADVVVHLDTRRAAARDELALTLDYGTLSQHVAGVLSSEPADLIETVAERIAATALADPTVAAVDVAVHKPRAPITVPFEDVVVRVHRDRHKLPAAEPWRRPAETQGAERRPAGPQGAERRPAEAQGAERRPVEPERAAADGRAGEAVRPSVPATAAPVHAGAAVAGGTTSSADLRAPGPSVSRPTPAVEHPDRLDLAPPGPVEAVLALGGNLGSAQTTLRAAVADIERIAGLEVVAVSPLARTAAVGGPSQPDFLNAVVIARTTLAPRALLHAVQGIEQRHGRERLERWGPRTLDIDLITYGSLLAVADDLELPHPRAHERAFVLQPWAQVTPDAVLPGLGGGPVGALAATAPDRDGVRWLALDWMTATVPSGSPEGADQVDGGRGADEDGDGDDQDHAHAHADAPEPHPTASGAPDGPMDRLPGLPPAGGSGTADDRTSGARSEVFSPVGTPDDVPHPGDR